jgi:hypothetical protein
MAGIRSCSARRRGKKNNRVPRGFIVRTLLNPSYKRTCADLGDMRKQNKKRIEQFPSRLSWRKPNGAHSGANRGLWAGHFRLREVVRVFGEE